MPQQITQPATLNGIAQQAPRPPIDDAPPVRLVGVRLSFQDVFWLVLAVVFAQVLILATLAAIAAALWFLVLNAD